MTPTQSGPRHPCVDRRTALQAGGVGLLGLGMNHVSALQAADVKSATSGRARACIYIFLSGGLAQHDSFDMKPDAPDTVRGEFNPISTAVPGLQVCEHLPKLAERSRHWSIVRSLSHPTNGHSEGHMIMLSGRTPLPPAFNGSLPKPTDWPSIASIAGAVTRPRNNLPPAVALPEKLVHSTGRVLPGQFGGVMGNQRDPWFIEASPFDSRSYGAYPEYGFDHQDRPHDALKRRFDIPNLSLPEGMLASRLDRRLALLDEVDRQRKDLERVATVAGYDRHRQSVVSLLSDQRIRQALDVRKADDATLTRYGNNSFGWSLLMALRLVEAGVNLVQVNLGNNETWDTHGEAFPHLKDNLFPPTDRALSALLDDLVARGMLDDTLIVMAGEFGRTPKISHLPAHYKLPGRDHWGAVQTVFFAGGGTVGGRAVGSSDKIGAYPAADPQTPETMAATIYRCLGLPDTVAWHDEADRPHHIYHGDPIAGLF